MQKYAGTIITWLICQQAIQERDRELYTYALYNMVLLIIPLGLTVIFGEIIGNVKQGIVMILPFITLRKYSGGYHAKTPLRCMIISSLLLFLCIKIIFELSCNWKLLIVTAIMGGSLIIFSPVDSQKRRLEKQQKEQYRKVVCEFVMFFYTYIHFMEIEHTEICRKYCGWDMAVGRITDSVFDKTINFSQKWKKNIVSVVKY